MSNINIIKDNLQKKALKTHHEFNCYSTLAMCTGAGKSRCGILRAVEVVDKNPNAKILLACFTTDQRDNVWRLEFDEWGYGDIYKNNVVDRVCYVSLGKVIDEHYDLVIMDECHHLTETSLPFFQTCQIDSILGLTATPPVDEMKKAILDAVAPISFIYKVEEGIKDGVVAPYEIAVVYTHLEDKLKTVVSGTKLKPFNQTEKSAYEYWDKNFTEKSEAVKDLNFKLYELGWTDKPELGYGNKELAIQNEININKLLKTKGFIEGQKMKAMSKRSNIIYNSYNKTRIAKRIINELCEDRYRYLFFAGSIAQSEEILSGMTYNSKSNKQAYEDFNNEKINKLCAVKGLNEGANIKNLDFGIVLQLNSKELDIIQRIGRVIRIRDNHVGKIIIVCVDQTRDKQWMNQALSKMKFIKINEYNEEEFFESVKQEKLFI